MGVCLCAFNCAYLVNTLSLEDVSNMNTCVAYSVNHVHMYFAVLAI